MTAQRNRKSIKTEKANPAVDKAPVEDIIRFARLGYFSSICPSFLSTHECMKIISSKSWKMNIIGKNQINVTMWFLM
ncbi:MAG: hypothetical protein ABFD02_12695 [Bacteroidales bacterium]